jgi:hypothetical protein
LIEAAMVSGTLLDRPAFLIDSGDIVTTAHIAFSACTKQADVCAAAGFFRFFGFYCSPRPGM